MRMRVTSTKGTWISRSAGLVIAVGLGAAAVVAEDLNPVEKATSAIDSSPATAQSASRHGEWPFRPPRRPAVPSIEGESAAHPVDAFVLHALRAAGLTGSPPADRPTLLRRVTFDLTGLPPTPAEQEAFLADESPGAYLKVVDRLLASPAYGERWGQHWLDVVRYAETEGFKADSLRPNAYRYRDYVIDAFNIDRPYDHFVRQQLAGDELEPESPQAVIATGLNRLYPDENNAANLIQRRQEILDDVTETTGLAFMGLTMGCAQCHDHKFDEILQVDYFRLQAFFAPMVERDDVPAATPAERAEYERRLAVWEAATSGIREEIDRIFAAQRKESEEYNLTKFSPEIQECVRIPEAERTPFQQQVALIALKQLKWRFDPKAEAGKLAKEDAERYRELEKRLAELEHLRPEPLPGAMAVSDVGRVAPPTHRLAGGNWRNPREIVEPGFPEFLGPAEPERPAIPEHSMGTTGRRSALAGWLTRAEHPLTARVIVNRLWQHHFGRGLVATPNDFGAQGDPPTHPELLDWLAVELVESGWSLKHLQRLMVASATYRQSSRIDPESGGHARALAADPDNRLLWHARRRRLEGEAIRDAMLEVAGELNRRSYGPSSRPRLPEGLSDRYGWTPDRDGRHQARRSIYVLAKRNLRYPLFDAFDQPDLHTSCGQRSNTITPPQALLMLNSELTLSVARRWAERLALRSDDPDAVVEEAYRAAFGRGPDPSDVALAREFLVATTAGGPASGEGGGSSVSLEALTDLCHALFNSSEFIYID